MSRATGAAAQVHGGISASHPSPGGITKSQFGRQRSNSAAAFESSRIRKLVRAAKVGLHPRWTGVMNPPEMGIIPQLPKDLQNVTMLCTNQIYFRRCRDNTREVELTKRRYMLRLVIRFEQHQRKARSHN
jgi:hypothetical protein